MSALFCTLAAVAAVPMMVFAIMGCMEMMLHARASQDETSRGFMGLGSRVLAWSGLVCAEFPPKLESKASCPPVALLGVRFSGRFPFV